MKRSLQIRRSLFVFAAVFAGTIAGCELVVDFDRGKVDAGGVDASIADVSSDTTTGNDAKADGQGDGATDAPADSPGADATDGNADAQSDAAADAPDDAAQDAPDDADDAG